MFYYDYAQIHTYLAFLSFLKQLFNNDTIFLLFQIIKIIHFQQGSDII